MQEKYYSKISLINKHLTRTLEVISTNNEYLLSQNFLNSNLILPKQCDHSMTISQRASILICTE